MSSGRQLLSIVGQVAGAAFGPIGSVVGGFIGGELGGAIDGPPQGPRLDDTSAPTLEFGSKVPRLYGRVWCTLSPRWWNGLRESSAVVGGKGADSGQEQFSYHTDLMGVLGEVDLTRWPNPVWTRIRIDGEIVASSLAASSTETHTITAETERWSDVQLFTGASTQAPWSVMETAVGATNANAYRGMVSIGFTSLLMANGRRPSLIEVEIVTSVTTTNGYLPKTWTFNGRAFFAPRTGPDDLDVYGGTNYDRKAGDWSVVINGFVPTESANTVNNNIVTWRSDPNLLGSYNIYIYLYSNTGQLRVSFNNGEGITTSQYMPTGKIELAFDSATNIATLYLNDANVGAVTASSAALPGLYNSAVTIGPKAPTGSDAIYPNTAYSLTSVAITTDSLPVPTYTPTTVDLRDVLESEMLRCKPLAAANIDMSAAAGRNVRGFKAADSAAAACATLLNWYYLDLYCADKIVCVLRGGAVEQSIAYAYTGSAIGGSSDPFAGLVRENDVERQLATSVSYININADGETDTQTGDRIGSGSEIAQVNFPLYAIATEAKGRANTITHDARVASHTASVRLGAKQGAKVQPGSVLTIVDNKGNSYRVRVLRLVWDRGVYEADVVLDDPTILTDVGITTEVDTQVINLVAPGTTELLLLDIPILRDVDNDPGYYQVISGTGEWHGAGVYESVDGVTYTALGDITQSATKGTATTVLGDWPQPWLIDHRSSVTVSVNGTLASYTHDAVIAGTPPPYLIGREIVYAMTATLVSAGVYTLSNFIRACQGTEWATASHAIGDVFVVLQTAGIKRGAREAGELNVAYQFKGVSAGSSLSSVAAQAFTDTGVGLKPYAPVNLKKEITDGATVVTWNRRTRLSSTFLGTTAPALGEASESYDVELYDAASALVSSSTVSTNLWSASGAAAFEHFVIPVLDIRTISSEQVGLREDAAPNYAFVRQTIAGGLIAQSPNLGSAVYQTANDGDELYAVTADLTTFTPSTYINAKAVRFTRTSLGAAAATYTAATAGDLHGIAYDGTNVWVTEFYGGNLRKLNKTTLASVATYVVSTGMRSLLFNAGSLWITRDYSSEVIQWNIGTATETQRFSVVTYPSQLLIVGSLLFVRGDQAVAAYTAATGALVASVTAPKYGLGMYVVGTYIAAVSSYGVVLINSTTGLEVTRFDTSITYNGTAYSYIRGVAGVVGNTIYVTLGGPGLSNQTVGFALGAAELTGYTVKVYQKSATVGRGYVAALAL